MRRNALDATVAAHTRFRRVLPGRMQRSTVTSSPVEEEDWRNGHVTQHTTHHPPMTLAPPSRNPSLPTSFPLQPPPTSSTPTIDRHPPTTTKQEHPPTDSPTSLPPPPHSRPHTNGSRSAVSAAVGESAARPFLIYSLSSPSDPVGVVDCSPLASLSSLRHLVLDELVSELSSSSFVFLYRGVKLTERQEQVKTVSNIAQRVDGMQADEAVYIRYINPAAADPPYSTSTSSSLYPLPAGLPPLVGASPSAVSSSSRLSFDQMSYLELLKLRDTTKQPPAVPASSTDAVPPKRKRGRPPKRRFDENGVEITDSSKRERLSAPSIMQPSQPITDSQPPLIPPPPSTANDPLTLTPATQRTTVDTSAAAGGAPSTSLALLPLLGSPTTSQPGSPKRRYRRTHAALMASWLAGDKGVKRCFTCGRVMTTGQQKQHRCDMEAEERQAKWRAEREEVMRQHVGGEVVIIGAEAPESSTVGAGGATEKEDGRKSRWRKLRAQSEQDATQRTSNTGENGEAMEQSEEKHDAGHAETGGDGDGEGQYDDGEDGDGEHDSGDTEDEDDLDNLPPLLQAQAAMDAVRSGSGVVKVERGGDGLEGGTAGGGR